MAHFNTKLRPYNHSCKESKTLRMLCWCQGMRLLVVTNALIYMVNGWLPGKVQQIEAKLETTHEQWTHEWCSNKLSHLWGPVHTGCASRFACKFACKSFDVGCNCLQCCVNTPIGNNMFYFLCATFASTSASYVNGASDWDKLSQNTLVSPYQSTKYSKWKHHQKLTPCVSNKSRCLKKCTDLSLRLWFVRPLLLQKIDLLLTLSFWREGEWIV